MRASKSDWLTIRNGTALPPDSPAEERPAAIPGRSHGRSRCDRAGRIRFMREAYAALLRKERAPAA
jgi:hypothetical protein